MTGANLKRQLIGGSVAGLVFLIELAPLGGREHLDGYGVHTFIRYE